MTYDLFEPYFIKADFCRLAHNSCCRVGTLGYLGYLVRAIISWEHCKAAELLRWIRNLYRDE